jgi:hypothetical protein
LIFFSLPDGFHVAFIGGDGGTYSVLLNKENLISDTFNIDNEYLKVSALLTLGKNKYLASTEKGLLSFSILNSKIEYDEFVTTKSKKRYDLAWSKGMTIYMKPSDVIRNKLKWRVKGVGIDRVIYESEAKFKNFKGVILPNVWNRIYFIDSVLVFNDPLNHKILLYNPVEDSLQSIEYPTGDNELRFFYFDSAEEKSYLVGFEQNSKVYKIYNFNFADTNQYVLTKTIEHAHPPKSIQDNAIFIEDAFLESDKNCIVRIPLD